MKYLLLAAGAAGLAACSPAETEAPAAEKPAEEVAAAPIAADGQPTPGAYRITDADGEVSNEVLSEDGTLTSTSADGTVETGRWEQKSPETFCVTMDAPDANQECFTETIDENGVWTSTDAEGATSTVERVIG